LKYYYERWTEDHFTTPELESLYRIGLQVGDEIFWRAEWCEIMEVKPHLVVSI
jgi:hypothetical protein